jgi:hypothetical protein
MKVGKWKIIRTHEPAGDYQYKVARVVSDGDGPSHVEDYQYADTREEAEAILRNANASGR